LGIHLGRGGRGRGGLGVDLSRGGRGRGGLLVGLAGRGSSRGGVLGLPLEGNGRVEAASVGIVVYSHEPTVGELDVVSALGVVAVALFLVTVVVAGVLVVDVPLEGVLGWGVDGFTLDGDGALVVVATLGGRPTRRHHTQENRDLHDVLVER